VRTMHRFKGTVGAECTHRFGSEFTARVCGRNYSNPVHYSDDDHPYAAPKESYDACQWRMQNIPAGSVIGVKDGGIESVRCGRAEADPVHHRLVGEMTTVMEVGGVGEKPRPEDVTFETPVAEPEKWDLGPGPVMDAPADDEGLRRAGSIGDSVRKLSDALKPFAPPPLPVRAAAALRGGDVVPEGPWPVRQWFAPVGGEWSFPGELISALNVAGEPFSVDVWWTSPETRLVRVTWGSLMGFPEEELASAVESWVI
jgi:hypothetical protein